MVKYIDISTRPSLVTNLTYTSTDNTNTFTSNVAIIGNTSLTGNLTLTNLPTSTVTPTTSTQLTTKSYVDSVSGVALAGTNAFTGTNTFNTNLPTSTATPTLGTQLTTKTYVDSQMTGAVFVSTSNAFTGTNTFNTNLPTSTMTPTTTTQLTTKSYVDTAITASAPQGLANNWTNTNTFTGNVIIGGSASIMVHQNYSLTLANCTAVETIQFIDGANNIVSMANLINGTSYRIITLKDPTTSIFYKLIHQTPGVVGIYSNAYDVSSNTTNYGFITYTVSGVNYAIWNYPFVMGSGGIVNIYMYGLTTDATPVPYLPTTQYAWVSINLSIGTITPISLNYISGATSNLQTQISTIATATTDMDTITARNTALASYTNTTGMNTAISNATAGMDTITLRNTAITTATTDMDTITARNTAITTATTGLGVYTASNNTTSYVGNVAISGNTSISGNLLGNTNLLGNLIITGNSSVSKNILFTTVTPTTSSIQMNQNPIYIGLNNDTSHYIKSDTSTSVSAGLAPNGVGIAGYTGVRLGSTQSGTSNILWAYGANGTATNEVGVNGKFSSLGATTLSSTLAVTGTTTLTGSLICNQIYETTIATTGTTSPFTCNMTNGSTFYIPSDYTFASNFQIIITNVPTDTTKSYTISVIYRQPTTTFYSNTARVSDTASTYLLGTSSTYSAPYFNGGTPSLANTPNLIVQSFSIISIATSSSTYSRYVTTSINNQY